jgi:hypothetical protein
MATTTLLDVPGGGDHFGGELDGLGNGLVHFPVAGDNDFAHGIPRCCIAGDD